MGKLKRQAIFPIWLFDVLEKQRSPKNAYWLNRENREFAIRWVHKKCTEWTPDCAELFELWRREGSRSQCDDYKSMKVIFRMNLNSKQFRCLDLPRQPKKKGPKVVKRYKFVAVTSDTWLTGTTQQQTQGIIS